MGGRDEKVAGQKAPSSAFREAPPSPPAFKGKARSLVLTDSRWAGCSTKVFSVFGTGLTERAP